MIADFLDGYPLLRRAPSVHLELWRGAYRGRAQGAVVGEAMPEPYLGDLLGTPRMVVLALNPGRAHLDFQSRSGVFADEIRRMGSYTAWAKSWPYLRDPWIAANGENRHHASRLEFLRRWTGDEALGSDAMLAFELFPWHSTKVTAPMRPAASIIQQFVWEPLADLGDAPVFAFGAPWFPLLEDQLGLRVVDRLGAGGRDYGSGVPSRSVLVLEAPGGGRVIACKHSGSAGPPNATEVERLRDALA